MKTLLITLLTLGALSANAQEVTPVQVPEKAVAQLEKMRKQTQNVVVVGRKGSTLPPETRPMLNKVLLQSATDFLTITAKKPTKEAYFKSVDTGLSRLMAMVPNQEDRVEVAEFYQDLLDIVGLESSEGRLVAFVEGGGLVAKP